MGDEVKCPECTRLNLTSFLELDFTEPSFSSAVLTHPFRDQVTGREHYHDTNQQQIPYTCTRGHHWIETPINTCWCGWTQNSGKN